jgi:hypothetical protein
MATTPHKSHYKTGAIKKRALYTEAQNQVHLDELIVKTLVIKSPILLSHAPLWVVAPWREGASLI